MSLSLPMIFDFYSALEALNMDNENLNTEVKEENIESSKTVKSKKYNVLKEIWEWVYTIAIAVIIALLIKTFLFDIVKVDGSSMYPTLHDNDRLIVTKLNYTPEQGDIIILDSTYKKRDAYFDKLATDEGKDELSAFEKLLSKGKLPDAIKPIYYVKRVIALPGQTIDLIDGYVYVDGEKLDEWYYDGITLPFDTAVEFPLTVEDDTVFVMGDNRMHSKDSRSSDLGLVPFDAILGKSQLRIWPINTFSLTK